MRVLRKVDEAALEHAEGSLDDILEARLATRDAGALPLYVGTHTRQDQPVAKDEGPEQQQSSTVR